jgi:hypothetical protein
MVLALPIGTPIYNKVMEKCHEHLSHATAISALATAPPMVTISPQGAPPTAPQGFHEFTTATTDTFCALANQGNTWPSISGTNSLSLTDQGKVALLKVSTASQQHLLATIVTTTYPMAPSIRKPCSPHFLPASWDLCWIPHSLSNAPMSLKIGAIRQTVLPITIRQFGSSLLLTLCVYPLALTVFGLNVS